MKEGGSSVIYTPGGKGKGNSQIKVIFIHKSSKSPKAITGWSSCSTKNIERQIPFPKPKVQESKQ